MVFSVVNLHLSNTGVGKYSSGLVFPLVIYGNTGETKKVLRERTKVKFMYFKEIERRKGEKEVKRTLTVGWKTSIITTTMKGC